MTDIALDQDLLDGIKRFIAHRDEPPRGKMSYNDAVNVIVRDWLMGQGYVPLPDQDLDAAIVPALEAAHAPSGR